ncbi:MAG: VOC family protein [Acidobacteria bacterium]|nr:VOC family protein [Acidobacteriota bacterium]
MSNLQGVELAASLTVKDLEASLRWYTEVFGFDVDRRHEREGKLIAISLRAGDVQLLINQDNGAKGLDRAKGEGFSMRITTKQSLDELARGIVERGGVLDQPVTEMPWGARMFRIQDPDGFRFTIST